MHHEQVASCREHLLEFGDDGCEVFAETLGPFLLGVGEFGRIELDRSEVVRLDPLEAVHRCHAVFARLHVEARLQRDVDDLAAEVFLGRRQFLRVERAQRIVRVAPPHGGADDGHPLGLRLVHDAVCVAAAEQLAAKKQYVPFLESGRCRYLGHCMVSAHLVSFPCVVCSFPGGGGEGANDYSTLRWTRVRRLWWDE